MTIELGDFPALDDLDEVPWDPMKSGFVDETILNHQNLGEKKPWFNMV